jgi:hypothetical protein
MKKMGPDLIDILKAYPYFFANLLSILMLLTVGRIFLSRQHWRVMLLSGLFNAPCFPFLIFLEKEYWSPARFGGWMLGIEDVFCSFWVAALVWLMVALSWRNQIILNDQVRISWYRYRIICGISVILFLLWYVLGFGGMGSLLLACGAIAILLLIQNRKPWPLFIPGIFLYPVLYLMMLKIFFWIWPDFVKQWNPVSFWGASTFLGIPHGEIAWAFIFGAYWPLFIAYVLDFRFSLSKVTGNTTCRADITQ